MNSITNIQETYCKGDDTCFSFLSSVAEAGYYGIKVRLTDLGTKPIPSNAQVCISVPAFRNFYVDKVYDKNKKSLELVPINSTGGKEQYETGCFTMGQLERFGDKHIYILLRKSPEPKNNDMIEQTQNLPDLKVSLRSKPLCGTMFLQGTFSLSSQLRLPVLSIPRSKPFQPYSGSPSYGSCSFPALPKIILLPQGKRYY